MDPDTLKAFAPWAVPAIKVAIESWLQPAIESTLKSKEFKKQIEADKLKAAFEEYLLRTYAKLSCMNTIVFGNQQKRIQDLYIPLTVEPTDKKHKSFKIDQWQNDFVPAFKRIVVTDTAGMGKSTLLKWLFLCSIGVSDKVPIFIELRSLSSTKSILDKIHDDLCPIDRQFDRELLLHLLKSGSFIVFLDGFDEVPFEDRQTVTQDIQEFINKAYKNYYILASRHETALASFGDFQEFSIKPLSKKEAYCLLKKYDESLEHAEALIAELDESKYEQLKELMVNPMLVSLLYKAYSYKPKVPFKKHIFYRQVFDALFDMHDSTKGGAFVRKKHSGLDIDEFHLILRDLGFTTAKLGKVEYEKDQISDIIKKVRERNTSVLFQPSSLLQDLITTVPLFNREGTHYKWAHKSVQDYFASQFIALDSKENEVALLEKIYDGGHCQKFENILDMLHDTDNKNFRNVLLARLFRDIINHYDSSYQHSYPGVPKRLVEDRKQLSFGFDIALRKITETTDGLPLGKSPRDLFKNLDSVFPKKQRGAFHMLIHSAKGEVILVRMIPRPAYGLLRLLLAKKYPFVSKSDRLQHNFDEIPPNKALLVTDDPTSPLNSAKCFEYTNGILQHHGFELSIDQARRGLKAIEEELLDETQTNQLFDNL